MPPKKEVHFAEEPHYAYIPTRHENKVDIPFHDPIGIHLMALRAFYQDLNAYRKKSRKVRKRFKRPTMPEYPIDYPSSSYLYSLRVRRSRANMRPELHFQGTIAKAQIDQLRTFAIIRILMQVGFQVEELFNDKLPLNHLSYISDVFLKSFVERLRFHKDSPAFCDDDDIWDPLETTLQEWSFGGVCGIAKYFYDDFLKTTDVLSADCIHMLDEVKKKERAEKKERKRQRRLKSRKNVQEINIEAISVEDNIMEIDLAESAENQ